MPTNAGYRLGCIGRASSVSRGVCASAPAITVPAIIVIPEAHFDCGGSIGRHCVEGDAPLPGELKGCFFSRGRGRCAFVLRSCYRRVPCSRQLNAVRSVLVGDLLSAGVVEWGYRFTKWEPCDAELEEMVAVEPPQRHA